MKKLSLQSNKGHASASASTARTTESSTKDVTPTIDVVGVFHRRNKLKVSHMQSSSRDSSKSGKQKEIAPNQTSSELVEVPGFAPTLETGGSALRLRTDIRFLDRANTYLATTQSDGVVNSGASNTYVDENVFHNKNAIHALLNVDDSPVKYVNSVITATGAVMQGWQHKCDIVTGQHNPLLVKDHLFYVTTNVMESIMIGAGPVIDPDGKTSRTILQSVASAYNLPLIQGIYLSPDSDNLVSL